MRGGGLCAAGQHLPGWAGGTAVREYALVFYGGRYPALGNLLYPPAAAVQGEPEA